MEGEIKRKNTNGSYFDGSYFVSWERNDRQRQLRPTGS
jgi:hypothetical protein